VDWIAHVLTPWIGCKLLQLKLRKLMDREIALVMLGAILPDIVALNYLLQALGIGAERFIMPFHTPVGAALVAAMISLMFPKWKRAFFLLTVGFATHFALDSLLLHADGGMALLFPFNWRWGFQLGLIPPDSWIPAIITIIIAACLLSALTKSAICALRIPHLTKSRAAHVSASFCVPSFRKTANRRRAPSTECRD